jgi:hypothetical protein
MTQLFVIRERLIKFYQNHTRIITPLLRFLVAFITFFGLSQIIGYNPDLKAWYVLAILSAVSAVLPSSVFLFLAAVYAVLHIYYVSIVLAGVLAVVFLFFYLVYIRFLREHGIVILAVPVLYALNVPYVVPLVMGLISSPIGVIPMGCGVICYYMLQSMTTVLGTATEDSVFLYNQTVQMLFANEEMYLMIAVFFIVMMVVYSIRNLEFSHAFELSVGVGAIVNVILMLGINVLFDHHFPVRTLLLQTLLSAVIAWAIQFWNRVLNYGAAEYLQFEDEEYYYYVKAVPKISMAAGEKRIKRFNAHLFGAERKAK